MPPNWVIFAVNFPCGGSPCLLWYEDASAPVAAALPPSTALRPSQNSSSLVLCLGLVYAQKQESPCASVASLRSMDILSGLVLVKV